MFAALVVRPRLFWIGLLRVSSWGRSIPLLTSMIEMCIPLRAGKGL